MSEHKTLFSKEELTDSMLFKGVELDSVMGLLQECPVQELQSGDIIIHSGQPNHYLYVLLSGQLRIHLKLSVDPVAMVSPGEVVGEMSLIDGQPASAFVVGAESCRLLGVNQKTLWSLVEASHLVARNLLSVLSSRLRHGNSIILSGQQMEREYEHYAVVDALTGLYNRRWFDKTLGRQMDRCKRAKWPLSLLLMDIDHFTQYNRDHGRQAGDGVLHSVSEIMKETMRAGELIARFGDDEFVAVLPDMDKPTARTMGERVRRALSVSQLEDLEGQPLPPVTVSLGVVQLGDEGSPDALSAAVEAALDSNRASS